MSTDAISPLRQRMIEDMSARKLNPHTQRSHISSCKRFAAYLKRSPGTATADEIRLFQLHLTETGTSICNRNRIMSRHAHVRAGSTEILLARHGKTGSQNWPRRVRYGSADKSRESHVFSN
jgi:hypothetical protein